MVRNRKPKQKRKKLGNRVFGKGDRKNCRGNGNRGGCGNAGMCKHKGTWAVKYAPGYFGKHGFANPTHKDIPVANLYSINHDAMLGKLEKKGNQHYFEFKGKVLATGKVTMPLLIKAVSWSKRVEEKLKAMGGSIENFGEKAKA
jgi:large subunit ribosomal protein L15